MIADKSFLFHDGKALPNTFYLPFFFPSFPSISQRALPFFFFMQLTFSSLVAPFILRWPCVGDRMLKSNHLLTASTLSFCVAKSHIFNFKLKRLDWITLLQLLSSRVDSGLWARATQVPCVRPQWRCQTCHGTMLAVWRTSRRNCKSWCRYVRCVCASSETPACYSFVCNKTFLRTHERLWGKRAQPVVCTNIFACILLRYSFENSAKL